MGIFWLIFAALRYLWISAGAMIFAYGIFPVIAGRSFQVGDVALFLLGVPIAWLLAFGWCFYKSHDLACWRRAIEMILTPAWGVGSKRVEHHLEHGETVDAIRPGHDFSKVVGMQLIKDRLLDAGKEATRKPPRGQAGNNRNGILLFGPPGTGKTFFAEALAGELKLKIMKVDFGSMASKWVNQTTEQMVNVFEESIRQAPCVLFIDEIDALLIKREKMTNSDSESARVVTSFLTQIQRARDAGVLVIGATNFIDRLDSAAIREGRFDFKIEVPLPDETARIGILRDRATKRGVITNDEVIGRVAKRWRGFSIARLNAVVDEVAREVAGREAQFNDFTAALRVIQGHKGGRTESEPSLDDLIMPAAMKKALYGISSRMHDIEKTEDAGGSIPHGVLFYGPPGTGKTFTARALAKSADWAFLSTSGNELLSKPERIDDLLRDASELRPCIVFIDEADDVFAVRQGGYAASITNRLLAAMDGAGGKVPDVVFIAATNHPGNFDPAALRGGRFTEKVEFTLPGRAEIETYVTEWLAKSKARFSLDPNIIARELDGLSMANVAAVLQQAVNISLNAMPNEQVDLNSLLEARRTVVG